MRSFGLIGYPLSHSFSKKYFTEKFQNQSISDATYDLFPLSEISQFKDLLASKANLVGLNVTIPYKESVIPYLDELDVTAKEVAAVNTIKVAKVNGETYLTGYNTDVIGFRKSIKPFLNLHHTNALIFGSGGASKAIAYVLTLLQIPYYIVSRNPVGENQIGYNDLDQMSIERFRLLINCTPLGMSPNENSMIDIPVKGITENHLVYDLVYNPLESKLLMEAKSRRAIVVNGLSMLRLQAEASWEIWNTI